MEDEPLLRWNSIDGEYFRASILQFQIKQNSSRQMQFQKAPRLPPAAPNAAQKSQKGRFSGHLRVLEFIQFNNHKLLIAAVHVIRLGAILHLLLAYLLLQSEPAAAKTQASMGAFMQDAAVGYHLLQGLAYFVKITTVVAIAIVVRASSKGIAWSICAKFIRFILPVSEVDLLLTAFLLMLNFTQNILPFLISASLGLLVNVVGQNYTNRKAHSYQCSQMGSLLYKMIHIVLFLGNSLVVMLRSPFYFYMFNLAASLCLFGWYKAQGTSLYPFPTPKYFTMAYVSLFSSLIILFFEKILLNTSLFVVAYAGKWVMLLIFVSGLLYFSDRQRRLQFKCMESREALTREMKEIDIQCSRLVASSCYEQEVDCFLVGLFRLHQQKKCTNGKCYSHLATCYDPSIKAKVETGSNSKEKESIMRFYVKCLYQQCLSSCSSVPLLLDFAEFLLAESIDLFMLSKVFSKIQLHHLGTFEALRLYWLKAAAREAGVKLNQLIFEGSLPIESILAAQGTFNEICGGVNDYLSRSLEVWQCIDKPEVNFSALRDTIKHNLAQLEDINAKWTHICNYLPFQRTWRLYYYQYHFFVLNQKPKQKTTVTSDVPDEAEKECVVLSPESKQELLFNSSFLFDKSTMYLHTYLFDGVSYLLRTNKSFEDISCFSEEELRGLQLNEILPKSIQATHDQSIVRWLQSGQSNNDGNYPTQFTQLAIKGAEPLPIVKYFKMMVNLYAPSEHFLQFVCMLKLNSSALSSQKQQSKAISVGTVTADSVNSNFLEKEVKFVLKAEHNLFMKEESLQSLPMMGELVKLKRALRCLLFVLLVITVGLLLLTKSNSNALNSYSVQYINFLNLYRYPMAFGKNMLKVFLKVGNLTKAVNQIHLEVTQIGQFLNDPMTIQSIFDEDLNRPALFPPFQNNSFNEGIAYNQIDLIYFLTSCIQSLNTLPANRTGEYFVNFNMYLAPSYDRLINSTKVRFHDSFALIFTAMLDNQLIVLGAEIAVFAVAMAYIAFALHQYFRKNQQTLKLVIDFSEEELQKILFYGRRLRLFFSNFGSESQQLGQSRRAAEELNRMQFTEEQLQGGQRNKRETSLNKRSKRIYHSAKETRREVKYMLAIVLLMVTILGVIVSFEITNIATITRLHAFQEDGYYFLRYFPATSVLGHAILQRYYNQVYPHEIDFFPQRYAESIADLSLIGHAAYIGEIDRPESQYFQDQKNYLFGNPCTANPAVLVAAQTTMAKCMSIYNKTFSQGITAFLRACEGQVNAFLNKQINLTASQVDEVTVALTLVAYYITDAIAEWSSEFTDMIVTFNFENGVMCALICSFLLLFHLLTCECFVLPKLAKEYELTRRVFKLMVPQDVLINQKVVKQKFIINGILRQD